MIRQLSKSSDVTSDRSSSPSFSSRKILSTSCPELRPDWSSVAHFGVPGFSRALSVGVHFWSMRWVSCGFFGWLAWFLPFLLSTMTGTEDWSRLEGRDWLRTIDGICMSSVEKSTIELFELNSLRSMITGCWVRFRFAGGSFKIMLMSWSLFRFWLRSWLRFWLIVWSRRSVLSKLGMMIGSSCILSRFALDLTKFTIGRRFSSNIDDRVFWTVGSLLEMVTISL